MLDRPTHQIRTVIVGAGMAGLAAAIRLSAEGHEVTVIEKASAPGGKARAVDVGAGAPIDSGPTVFTMKWVFDALLALTGTRLEDHVRLAKADILARHGWGDGSRLDLHADRDKSADAIGRFAGAGAAKGYLRFHADSRAIFETLKDTYIAAARPSPVDLARRIGAGNLGRMLALKPFTTLAGALSDYFDDPRLVQLFARYATYCGSSPFASPATLMLVAHVEQDGVWLVEGGMHRLAAGLAKIAETRGARFRFATPCRRIETTDGRVSGVILESGERIAADAVIHNGDPAALSGGLAGPVRTGATPTPPAKRSLSAVTASFRGKAEGFSLAHHTVFFADRYRAEFDAIFSARRVPDQPTVYVCAQDRDDEGRLKAGVDPAAERLFCLINAPADGDRHIYREEESAQCLTKMLHQLARCGLTLTPAEAPTTTLITTPSDFERLFPGSGGALYGPAQHGWMASFSRPGARTRVPGLYQAGGSVHPGPGVPMAALSGRLAAESLMTDLASMPPSRRAAISGGMSTA